MHARTVLTCNTVLPGVLQVASSSLDVIVHLHTQQGAVSRGLQAPAASALGTVTIFRRHVCGARNAGWRHGIQHIRAWEVSELEGPAHRG